MKQLLIKLNACNEAMEWAGDKTWEEIYRTCHRGDWLLWLFKQTNPNDLRLLTLAKGHCANTVRHLMKDERSIKAVDAAIAYGEGRIDIEELNNAATTADAVFFATSTAATSTADAYAAYAATATSTAAAAYAATATSTAAAAYAATAAAAYAYAAYADAYAAYAAADAADAYADADAADAAAYAAADAAYAAADAAYAAYAAADAADAAKKNNQQQTADICRQYLPIKIWNINL